MIMINRDLNSLEALSVESGDKGGVLLTPLATQPKHFFALPPPPPEFLAQVINLNH